MLIAVRRAGRDTKVADALRARERSFMKWVVECNPITLCVALLADRVFRQGET